LFGVVVPVLQGAGEISSNFGQLVIAGAMFAEFGSIILLSLFFSRQASSTVTKLVLLANPSTILRVPLFLAALLLVRGVPALLYRPLVGLRHSIPAGLLQATSLSFIVAATQMGRVLGLMTKATGAALIAAELLSVLIFPVIGLTLLKPHTSTQPGPLMPLCGFTKLLRPPKVFL
jgi:Kef-type K+ transport system membrane component KefB